MCNRYVSPQAGDIERYWHVGGRTPWRGGGVFRRSQGAFIRAARDSLAYERELVIGQWGLVPWFAKTPKLSFSTNNARSEELADKATFKLPWARGQRCKTTGEMVESYTMLTINADAHPLMKRMHKPDPKLAADKQDKRSVVSIEPEDVD